MAFEVVDGDWYLRLEVPLVNWELLTGESAQFVIRSQDNDGEITVEAQEGNGGAQFGFVRKDRLKRGVLYLVELVVYQTRDFQWPFRQRPKQHFKLRDDGTVEILGAQR